MRLRTGLALALAHCLCCSAAGVQPGALPPDLLQQEESAAQAHWSRFSDWCHREILSQTKKRGALERLRGEVSASDAGAVTVDKLSHESESLAQLLETKYHEVSVCEARQAQAATAVEDLERQVVTLKAVEESVVKRSKAKGSSEADFEGSLQVVRDLLSKAKQSQDQAVAEAKQGPEPLEKEAKGVEAQYTQKAESLGKLRAQRHAADVGRNLLSSAMEEEDGFLVDLQSICALGNTTYQRMDSTVRPALEEAVSSLAAAKRSPPTTEAPETMPPVMTTDAAPMEVATTPPPPPPPVEVPVTTPMLRRAQPAVAQPTPGGPPTAMLQAAPRQPPRQVRHRTRALRQPSTTAPALAQVVSSRGEVQSEPPEPVAAAPAVQAAPAAPAAQAAPEPEADPAPEPPPARRVEAPRPVQVAAPVAQVQVVAPSEPVAAPPVQVAAPVEAAEVRRARPTPASWSPPPMPPPPPAIDPMLDDDTAPTEAPKPKPARHRHHAAGTPRPEPAHVSADDLDAPDSDNTDKVAATESSATSSAWAPARREHLKHIEKDLSGFKEDQPQPAMPEPRHASSGDAWQGMVKKNGKNVKKHVFNDQTSRIVDLVQTPTTYTAWHPESADATTAANAKSQLLAAEKAFDDGSASFIQLGSKQQHDASPKPSAAAASAAGILLEQYAHRFGSPALLLLSRTHLDQERLEKLWNEMKESRESNDGEAQAVAWCQDFQEQTAEKAAAEYSKHVRALANVTEVEAEQHLLEQETAAQERLLQVVQERSRRLETLLKEVQARAAAALDSIHAFQQQANDKMAADDSGFALRESLGRAEGVASSGSAEVEDLVTAALSRRKEAEHVRKEALSQLRARLNSLGSQRTVLLSTMEHHNTAEQVESLKSHYDQICKWTLQDFQKRRHKEEAERDAVRAALAVLSSR